MITNVGEMITEMTTGTRGTGMITIMSVAVIGMTEDTAQGLAHIPQVSVLLAKHVSNFTQILFYG